jgi:hypothetical protein
LLEAFEAAEVFTGADETELAELALRVTEAVEALVDFVLGTYFDTDDFFVLDAFETEAPGVFETLVELTLVLLTLVVLTLAVDEPLVFGVYFETDTFVLDAFDVFTGAL